MWSLDAFKSGPAEVQCEPYSPGLRLTPGYFFPYLMFLEWSLLMIKSCAYSDCFYLQDLSGAAVMVSIKIRAQLLIISITHWSKKLFSWPITCVVYILYINNRLSIYSIKCSSQFTSAQSHFFKWIILSSQQSKAQWPYTRCHNWQRKAVNPYI